PGFETGNRLFILSVLKLLQGLREARIHRTWRLLLSQGDGDRSLHAPRTPCQKQQWNHAKARQFPDD
ncbi:MAG TPA: hypothetical protein PKD05_19970, partial [Candidatus Melainabacteria bacterium]|nr:hypothetical protein [Candidatus Melainabacteria bacterium]